MGVIMDDGEEEGMSRDRFNYWIEDVRKSIVHIGVLVFLISLRIFLTGIFRASFTC